MDDLLEYWCPWYNHWFERKEDLNLISTGFMLNHYRTQVFAPNIKLPSKVSLKLVKKELGKNGIVYSS